MLNTCPALPPDRPEERQVKMTDLNRYYTVKGKGKNKKVVRKEIPKEDKEVPTMFGSKPPEENQKNKCEILPEPLNEKEPEKLRNSIMKHPAFVLYEWPEVPEISKQENPVSAWLAEATAYIALHLQSHNCFRLEISNEDLKSLKLIYKTFKAIQNTLPSVLPNYENRYNQVYKPFQETLQNFDSIADTPAKRAGIFLGQVKDFLDLVLTIHSETLRKYGKVAQTPAIDSEAEPKTTPAKRRGIKAWLKRHPHSYGLIGGAIFLILFFILGLLKVQWRNWCWGTAVIAFLVLILSLLGGRHTETDGN
jgi:hypothetical protein